MTFAPSKIGRLDRFVSTQLVLPAIRTMAVGDAAVVAVLMYHGVSRELDSHRRPYFRTVTSPETFKSHLRILQSDAFVVVTLSKALEILGDSRQVIPNRIPVVITFDDGLQNFYTDAFPLLEEAGFKATVFLTSGCIDGLFPTGEPCLTSAQIQELSRYGIEFGSHTVTHVRLVEQTAKRLERELADSRARIEAIVGQEADLFSFPFRFPAENRNFVDYLGQRLSANGYRAGVTTIVGRATTKANSMFLPRLPINDCDDDAFFRAKLLGGYDWFVSVQRAYKTCRSILARQTSPSPSP